MDLQLGHLAPTTAFTPGLSTTRIAWKACALVWSIMLVCHASGRAGGVAEYGDPSPVFFGEVIEVGLLQDEMKECFAPGYPEPFLSVVRIRVDEVYAGNMDTGEHEVLSVAGYFVNAAGGLGVRTSPFLGRGSGEFLLPGVTAVFVLRSSGLNACGRLMDEFKHLRTFESVDPVVRGDDGVLYLGELQEIPWDREWEKTPIAIEGIQELYQSNRRLVRTTARSAEPMLLDLLIEYEAQSNAKGE